MESHDHIKYQFGLAYPNNLHGIGEPKDIVAFFMALKLITSAPEQEFPLIYTLWSRPVFGSDMLPLFEEAKRLRLLMAAKTMTKDVLKGLGLIDRKTKLHTDASNVAGVFEPMFYVLAEDAPEFVGLRMEKPGDNTLTRGSVRIGPIEPLIPSELFCRLPASAFDDSEPPLWLRDEIFDEAFYEGKI